MTCREYSDQLMSGHCANANFQSLSKLERVGNNYVDPVVWCDPTQGRYQKCYSVISTTPCYVFALLHYA
jgi:hypothetical protein